MINADVERSGDFVLGFGCLPVEERVRAGVFGLDRGLMQDPSALPTPTLDFFFLVISATAILSL